MSSGFQFIEQPLFIKNCGPATTIPMIIYTDSGTYEGCSLAITYVTSSSSIIAQKWISLDDYEYSDTSVQKIKGFFENNMWTGASGNILRVRLFDHTGLVKEDNITVVEEYAFAESLENAFNKLYTFLAEQSLVSLDLSEMSGFGWLINKADEYMACKIITNLDQYSGHPLIDLRLQNPQNGSLILRNVGYSGGSKALLHREFTKKTNYILTFGFYSTSDTKSGFMYGFDPNLTSGADLSTSSGAYGLNIVTKDTGNTIIETFDNGVTIPLYTHTSNLFTGGAHHSVSIHRNGMTAEIYIDKELIFTYNNIRYNTIGLNKWGSEYNQIFNIQISVDPE